jgi:hypothetical protein
MDVGTSVEACSESSELMKPSQRPLNDPSMDAQPAAGVGIASGDDRSDAPLAKLPSMGIGIVATISLDTARTAPGTPRLSSYRSDRIHQRDQLGYIVGIGTCQDGC